LLPLRTCDDAFIPIDHEPRLIEAALRTSLPTGIVGDRSDNRDAVLPPTFDKHPRVGISLVNEVFGRKQIALLERSMNAVEHPVVGTMWNSSRTELSFRASLGAAALGPVIEVQATQREIRDRSCDSQRYRASGLNLVVAAIILWNTVYLKRAITALRREQEIDEALLAHIAPLGWNHINLTGDYVWRADKRIAQGGFKSLRRGIPLSVPALA
jgi:hypothetical protein